MDDEKTMRGAPAVGQTAAAQPARHDGVLIFEEFEEGDPRRGPHFIETQMEADVQARLPGRWHRLKRHVDWCAIRLTVGRGYAKQQAAHMFGVSDSQISTRAEQEKWVAPMAESDRRELSVLVWLAGVKRLPRGDEKAREALKIASEWRPKRNETPQPWREKERQGEPLHFTINEEIPDDAFFSDADPKREERRAVVDELEAKLRELEAQWEQEDDEEQDEQEDESEAESAPVPDRPGESPDQAGALGGLLDQSGSGEEGVACVGAAFAASS